MLQPAGDLGFEEEPGAAGGIVGVVVEDLLEGDFAVKLAVERDEDRAQPAACMGPQHAETLAVAGGWPQTRPWRRLRRRRARSDASPSRRGQWSR